MHTEKPILHASLKKPRTNEVRHLLIYSLDGARETMLIQLSAGVEAPIATGTQYEMQQRAEAVAHLCTIDEEFQRQPQNQFVFETLKGAVALAMKMGYNVVYDTRYKQMDRLPFNLTGAVPLALWPGVPSKNGGGYEYGFADPTIHALPTLPPGQEATAPRDVRELAAFVKQLHDTFGRPAEFILG